MLVQKKSLAENAGLFLLMVNDLFHLF